MGGSGMYLGYNKYVYILSRGKKHMTTEAFMYGTSGREKRFRHCFVCQRIAKRVQTSNYCVVCRVPVCPPTKIRLDRFGNQFVRWNKLHSEKSIVDAAAAKKKD